MKNIFISLLGNVCAFWVSEQLLMLKFNTTKDYFIAALILTIVNITIQPLCKLLTWPLRVMTLGLFTVLINMGMIALTAFFVEGMFVRGFFSLFIVALIISVFLTLLRFFIRSKH